MVKNQPASAGDRGSIPELGRSPGEGNGNPLQYSCLGNPMDRRACQAIIRKVTKSWKLLKQRHASTPVQEEISQKEKVKVKVVSVRLFVTPWTIHTIHGIFQTRILEWEAFSFSKRSSQPRDQTQVSSIAGGFFTS